MRREDAAAVTFGRNVLSQGSRSQAEEKMLTDTLSLIGRSDPFHSPAGYLLGMQHRTQLAASLNSVILDFKGRKPDSALEMIYKQLVRTIEPVTGNPVLHMDYFSCR